MKKIVEISRHINLYDEASFLLYFWINHDNMEELKKQYADNCQEDIENYNKKTDLIIEMYTYVKEQLMPKKDLISYYFKDRTNNFSTFGSLALLWDQYRYDSKLQTYEESFQSMTDEKKVKLFAKIISCDDAENTSPEKLQTLSDLIAFIDISAYEKEAKWEVVKIFCNAEKYYKEAYQLIQETIHLLQERFGSHIAEFEQNFYHYWSEFQKEENLLDTLEEKMSISWKQSGREAIVLPLIFLPFTIAVSIENTKPQHRDVIRMSVIMDRRFALAVKKTKQEDVIKMGKLLSDKSKVDILEFISKSPAYGKEIADALGLSTATISYHVNALLTAGLLKTNISSNKIYYSINSTNITAQLDEIKMYFLQLQNQVK